ncbi:MAG: EboA family metabolite traffic protein [Cyanobacteria bacterium P01_G01_bin.38]
MASTANISQVKTLLHEWLVRQVPMDPLTWLEGKLKQVSENGSDRLLFTTFSAVPRYTGKADLKLTDVDLQAAEAARPGWSPAEWSLDQVGRTLLLLSLPSEAGEHYQAQLEKLFGAADVSEQIALYQSLPLLPHPERFSSRAAEGLRTSIDAVFNAIALRNPFPGDYFETPAWNQMILKAVFVGSPLHLVQQLDQRANPELARMLSDYAHERWAAKRQVTPELWRLIGPFLNDQFLADIQQALQTSDKTQQMAAALACTQSSLPAAQAILQQHPTVRDEITSMDWERFSQSYLAA